ncbi:hypothetical protein ACQPZK_30635 [Micromonospora sp. CA-249363]|uniref:hypothetical protein n=1 Tax=Micromonospora sp. CA-249363 TaxID=3239963 RepID=UPI003D8FDE05
MVVLLGVAVSGSAVRGDSRGATGSEIALSWAVEREVALPGVALLGAALLGVALLGVFLLGGVARVGAARLRGVGVISVGSGVTGVASGRAGVASGRAGVGGGGAGVVTAAVLVALLRGRGARAFGGWPVGSSTVPEGVSSLAG